MEIMISSISLEEKLLRDGIAKCPKCEEGIIKPSFPEHKKIYDYECNVCGYKLHFEPAVVVE